ncbi:hypothetical protein ACHAWF_004357 [Thalassiosira exigua]
MSMSSPPPSPSLSQSLWDAAYAPLISATESHPFLVSMVDGTLDLASFRYYVVQDALYLVDFADCLRRLGDRMLKEGTGSDAEEAGRRLRRLATGAEEDEKELHRSFFKQWNIDATGVEPMPNTLLYTSYMIRVVATRPIEEGLAVLLPCYWVYMHVGKCMLALREKLGDATKRPTQFDAWIDMYGGEEFEREVKEYIAIVDAVAKDADSATLRRMEEHFAMSCKLEHMFWDQAQDMMRWPEFAPTGTR